jgi:hypothetical protein
MSLQKPTPALELPWYAAAKWQGRKFRLIMANAQILGIQSGYQYMNFRGMQAAFRILNFCKAVSLDGIVKS